MFLDSDWYIMNLPVMVILVWLRVVSDVQPRIMVEATYTYLVVERIRKTCIERWLRVGIGSSELDAHICLTDMFHRKLFKEIPNDVFVQE